MVGCDKGWKGVENLIFEEVERTTTEEKNRGVV